MIFGSIVLYNNKIEELDKTINSFLSTRNDRILYLIDNSPTDILRSYFTDSRIIYSHTGNNLGFGAAHNIAIQESLKLKGRFHFIINPDILFDPEIIDTMINYIRFDNTIGMMMPKILNFDGTIQHLPKLLPTPLSILYRKLLFPSKFKNRFLEKYELRSLNQTTPVNLPILSGCFTLINLEILPLVGLYDDKYFMYFEDWDLSRRMHKVSKTIYFPLVYVYHGYESGANKNIKLFFTFINSAVYYFTKWGWFFDTDRKFINKKVLKNINV